MSRKNQAVEAAAPRVGSELYAGPRSFGCTRCTVRTEFLEGSASAPRPDFSVPVGLAAGPAEGMSTRCGPVTPTED